MEDAEIMDLGSTLTRFSFASVIAGISTIVNISSPANLRYALSFLLAFPGWVAWVGGFAWEAMTSNLCDQQRAEVNNLTTFFKCMMLYGLLCIFASYLLYKATEYNRMMDCISIFLVAFVLNRAVFSRDMTDLELSENGKIDALYDGAQSLVVEHSIMLCITLLFVCCAIYMVQAVGPNTVWIEIVNPSYNTTAILVTHSRFVLRWIAYQCILVVVLVYYTSITTNQQYYEQVILMPCIITALTLLIIECCTRIMIGQMLHRTATVTRDVNIHTIADNCQSALLAVSEIFRNAVIMLVCVRCGVITILSLISSKATLHGIVKWYGIPFDTVCVVAMTTWLCYKTHSIMRNVIPGYIDMQQNNVRLLNIHGNVVAVRTASESPHPPDRGEFRTQEYWELRMGCSLMKVDAFRWINVGGQVLYHIGEHAMLRAMGWSHCCFLTTEGQPGHQHPCTQSTSFLIVKNQEAGSPVQTTTPATRAQVQTSPVMVLEEPVIEDNFVAQTVTYVFFLSLIEVGKVILKSIFQSSAFVALVHCALLVCFLKYGTEPRNLPSNFTYRVDHLDRDAWCLDFVVKRVDDLYRRTVAFMDDFFADTVGRGVLYAMRPAWAVHKSLLFMHKPIFKYSILIGLVLTFLLFIAHASPQNIDNRVAIFTQDAKGVCDNNWELIKLVNDYNQNSLKTCTFWPYSIVFDVQFCFELWAENSRNPRVTVPTENRFQSLYYLLQRCKYLPSRELPELDDFGRQLQINITKCEKMLCDTAGKHRIVNAKHTQPSSKMVKAPFSWTDSLVRLCCTFVVWGIFFYWDSTHTSNPSDITLYSHMWVCMVMGLYFASDNVLWGEKTFDVTSVSLGFLLYIASVRVMCEGTVDSSRLFPYILLQAAFTVLGLCEWTRSLFVSVASAMIQPSDMCVHIMLHVMNVVSHANIVSPHVFPVVALCENIASPHTWKATVAMLCCIAYYEVTGMIKNEAVFSNNRNFTFNLFIIGGIILLVDSMRASVHRSMHRYLRMSFDNNVEWDVTLLLKMAAPTKMYTIAFLSSYPIQLLVFFFAVDGGIYTGATVCNISVTYFGALLYFVYLPYAYFVWLRDSGHVNATGWFMLFVIVVALGQMHWGVGMMWQTESQYGLESPLMNVRLIQWSSDSESFWKQHISDETIRNKWLMPLMTQIMSRVYMFTMMPVTNIKLV